MVTVLAMVAAAGLAGAADQEERVVLHAEEQLGTAEGWHGEGNVQIIYQDIEIRCDEADWDRSTGCRFARLCRLTEIASMAASWGSTST